MHIIGLLKNIASHRRQTQQVKENDGLFIVTIFFFVDIAEFIIHLVVT
jgi:hypothetical protein